jgi:uncharacterized protein (TIGR02266 family)
MSQDKRKFKRLKTDWIVKIKSSQAPTEDLERIKDVSLGGVFIETRYPFEIGRMVEFEFKIPGLAETLVARGVVRWSNDGSLPDQPLGMGIQFVELASAGVDRISTMVEIESPKEATPISLLTKTPLHVRLLKFYHQRKGTDTYDVAVLAEFFQTGAESLAPVLKDFHSAGIIEYSLKKAKFLPVKSGKLKDEIESFIAKNP